MLKKKEEVKWKEKIENEKKEEEREKKKIGTLQLLTVKLVVSYNGENVNFTPEVNK